MTVFAWGRRWGKLGEITKGPKNTSGMISHNLACGDSFMDQNLSVVYFMYVQLIVCHAFLNKAAKKKPQIFKIVE